jgi:hypothetical protein
MSEVLTRSKERWGSIFCGGEWCCSELMPVPAHLHAANRRDASSTLALVLFRFRRHARADLTTQRLDAGPSISSRCWDGMQQLVMSRESVLDFRQ